MSATSTNIVQANIDPPRPLLRPIFYILRPGNRLVPLIAGDELPSWLKVVGSYFVDMTNSVTVNDEPYARKGEYDIICEYCVDATRHVENRSINDADQEEQGRSALLERGYAPTAQNQYMQRVPATFETPVQQLKQPQPIQPSLFLEPSPFRQPTRPQQPAQFPEPEQAGPPNLPPIQPTQTVRPPLLPTISSLSLPSLPSLPSQPSGIQQLQQQAALQSLQLQYPQLPPYAQYWDQQERGRTRHRDQLRFHFWKPPSIPRQRYRRALPRELRPRGGIPYVIVSEGEQTRGLSATAPAFVPSAAPQDAPPATGRVDE